MNKISYKSCVLSGFPKMSEVTYANSRKLPLHFTGLLRSVDLPISIIIQITNYNLMFIQKSYNIKNLAGLILSLGY